MSINKGIISIVFSAFLLALLVESCTNGFNKNRFLSACQLSFEGSFLSEEEEYDEISSRWRNPQLDSLYRVFQKTHNHSTALQICRSYGKGHFLRSLGRGADSLLADDAFARAITGSNNRDEVIELVLIYGWDKPYNVQKAIGEECLKSKYFVSDTLKYIALNYAIDGNYYQDDFNTKVISKYCRERMQIAADVFGEESQQAFLSLYECAQLCQLNGSNETDVADSLFHYLLSHDVSYPVSNLYVDPLYLRFISCLQSGDTEHASDLIDYLTNAITPLGNHQYDFESYAEAKVLIMYENARLRFIMNDSSYTSWIDKAIDLSLSYLSPAGGFVKLTDYLKPDYVFYRPLVDLMDVAYNTSNTEKAYNTALFVKGTSSLLAPSLIRAINNNGDSLLIGYIDSLRINYNPHPFAGRNPFLLFSDPEFETWTRREGYFENRLNEFITRINADSLWNSCITSYLDIYYGLDSDESAIEIIQTYPFIGKDDYYDALIINGGDPHPIRERICSRDLLIDLLNKGHLYDGESSVFFDSIIKPMMSHVTGKTVYLSPSGLFSLVNLSFISDNRGKHVSDVWDIRTCISTKAIQNSKQHSTNKYHSIALFGGMEYGSESRTPHNFDTTVQDIEREGFGYLPASLEEVSEIDSIATTHQIQSRLFIGTKGSEEEFRNLSGKDISIIHLATHGFYYNSTQSESRDYLNLIGKDDLALSRCGIVFSDCLDAWINGIDPYDINNGILLGSEIANLDLLNTDLVVLSACNTGLGEITNEGISGLQQAFKKAGAGALLLSLRPVNDEATMLFMIEFYKHLFDGAPLQSSFEAAIDFLKSHPRFGDSEFWTSYILVH